MAIHASRLVTLSFAAAAAAAAISCTQSGVSPSSPSSTVSGVSCGVSNPRAGGDTTTSTATATQIRVCKNGANGTFDVVLVSGSATVVGTGFTITAGTCREVAETASSASVSVTENPSTNL